MQANLKDYVLGFSATLFLVGASIIFHRLYTLLCWIAVWYNPKNISGGIPPPEYLVTALILSGLVLMCLALGSFFILYKKLKKRHLTPPFSSVNRF